MEPRNKEKKKANNLAALRQLNLWLHFSLQLEWVLNSTELTSDTYFYLGVC